MLACSACGAKKRGRYYSKAEKSNRQAERRCRQCIAARENSGATASAGAAGRQSITVKVEPGTAAVQAAGGSRTGAAVNCRCKCKQCSVAQLAPGRTVVLSVTDTTVVLRIKLDQLKL
jgi:hypothetical protein